MAGRLCVDTAQVWGRLYSLLLRSSPCLLIHKYDRRTNGNWLIDQIILWIYETGTDQEVDQFVYCTKFSPWIIGDILLDTYPIAWLEENLPEDF